MITRVFMVRKDGRFAVVVRDYDKSPRKNFTGKYALLPGGAVDAGEDVIAGAVRELTEEVGCSALSLFQVFVGINGRGDAVTFYACDEWEGELKICEPEKFDGLEWVTGKEYLDRYTETSEIKCGDVIRDAIRHGLHVGLL